MDVVRNANVIYPASDRDRIANAFMLRQFLEGDWTGELAKHGTKQLGALRAKLVGEWDTGSNLFRSFVEQTCTMYDEEPGQPPGPLRDLFQDGGWWAMARQHQQYVRGLHESLVYVGWDSEMRIPTFEHVTADLVTIEAAPTNRARAETIWRAKHRPVPGSRSGEGAWYWDRWSTAGGGSFTIWTNDRARDVTTQFPEATAGWTAYPYKDEEQRPILPFALYHDRGPGKGIWSPTKRDSEIIFGTKQSALLWTAAVHGVLRASWSQRLLFNGKVKGGTTETVVGYAVRTVTPDPTAILQVDGENAREGEWGSAIDIDASERFARMYGARLMVEYGLPPSDMVIESLNPASGASITVSQTGKRRIAARDRLPMRTGDARLAEVVAAVGRANGRPASAKGWSLRYHGVALTIDEREKVVRYVAQELELGVADRVTAYQEIHPGTSTEDAETDLTEIDKRRMLAEDLGTDPAAEVTDPSSSPAKTSETPVADTAMNGAQVIAAQSIVQAVADSQLPRDSGIAMLEEFFQLDAAAAGRVMGTVGNGFEPKAKAAPSPFGGGPPPAAEPDPDADPVAET